MSFICQLKSEIIKEIKTTQNKFIDFCLNLGKMAHISLKKFETLNWLPIRDTFHQCALVRSAKVRCPDYLTEVLKIALNTSN